MRSAKVDEDGSGSRDFSETEGVFEGRVRGLLVRIGAAVRLIAAGNADLLGLLAQFADLRPPAAGREVLFDEFAPEDVAAVLGVSSQAAAGQMLFACTVARRLPHATDACRRAVHTVDPAGAAARARARRKERRVWVSPGEEGASCLLRGAARRGGDRLLPAGRPDRPGDRRAPRRRGQPQP
ncbi:hypothetical protein [Parafrankia sp. Ea1.12]|uniref:hypothetical protein n=1 Tax=Parafrankia sp. Ea1.12 TaxID=573499 RepID=UPI001F22A603|nr:hypothetical protein [Parafrankia sp. Ea1.12]